MARPPAHTLPALDTPLIFLVGADDQLREGLAQAAHAVTLELRRPAEIEEVTFESLTQEAVAQRPFAIVMTDDVFRFAPRDLDIDLLARDIRARLIRIPADGAPLEDLATWLVEAARARFSPT